MCLLEFNGTALMEALDEDGGGEIDLAEFSTWWSVSRNDVFSLSMYFVY